MVFTYTLVNAQATLGSNTFTGNQIINGNVCIGTTAPSKKLEIIDGGGRFTFSAPYCTKGYEVAQTINNKGYKLTIGSGDKDYSIKMGGFDRFVINSSGYVGIGTPTPQAKLDVNGNIKSNDINIGSSIILGTGKNQFIFHRQSWLPNNPPKVFIAPRNVNNTNWDFSKQITIDNTGSLIVESGNVGIGTTTPKAKLEVMGIIRSSELITTSLISPNDNGSGAIDFTNNGFGYQYSAKLFTFRSPDLSEAYGMTNDYGPGTSGHLAIVAKTRDGSGNIGFYAGSDAIERLRIASNGFVGIGTTEPKAKLEVVGTFRVYQPANPNIEIASGNGRLQLGSATCDGCFATGAKTGDGVIRTLGTTNNLLLSMPNDNNDGKSYIGIDDGANGTWCKFFNNKMLSIDGNVGIGTSTPNGNLEIASSTGGVLTISTNTRNGSNAAPLLPTIDFLGFANGNKARITATEETAETYSSKFSILVNDGKNKTSLVERFTISNNGCVGIGTTTPDALLTVNGVIHAKEVRVDVTGPLADYVFHPSYNLMPLTEVEQYVKTNSHLPEIPSAAEVSKNGINMGEMQNKLLQKIEELTLYVIEQNKTIVELQNKVSKLEK